MLKAYAMALAVSTSAPVADKINNNVSDNAKAKEVKVVIADSNKTEFFSWPSRAKKKRGFLTF